MVGAGLDGEEEKSLINLAKRLISIPSSARDGREIFDFVDGYLKERGLKPFFQKMKSLYMEYQDQSNLLLRLGDGGGGPRVMVNCHLDTVEGREGWFHDPFGAVEDDGRIYGLGAADMRGVAPPPYSP